jgi:hypothetical protein
LPLPQRSEAPRSFAALELRNRADVVCGPSFFQVDACVDADAGDGILVGFTPEVPATVDLK